MLQSIERRRITTHTVSHCWTIPFTTRVRRSPQKSAAEFGLEGLLPPSVESLDRQVERVMQHLDAKPTDLERYIYLIGLCDRNETLFYRAVMSDPARFIPILYDPTVADACLAFGHIFRRARGMYITREMKGRMAEVLRNWPERDVRFICVSTGGRILGLGDIGANGMGIPIGKLQLYTACAAVPPACLLPVLFDIGTTNDALRADPLYLGLREKPPSERELDELVEEFVQAVQQVFPGCCIHFEDWKGTDAIRLLARYQGQGAVLQRRHPGHGQRRARGADDRAADRRCAADRAAHPVSRRRIGGDRHRQYDRLGDADEGAFAGRRAQPHLHVRHQWPAGAVAHRSIRSAEGLCAQGGALEGSRQDHRDLQADHPDRRQHQGRRLQPAGVEAMSRLNERPIIFALSNPTDKAECTAEQAYTWSKGKALYAAGVQFPEVTINGKTFHPGQANNFYIFPAIGLATYVARPRAHHR